MKKAILVFFVFASVLGYAQGKKQILVEKANGKFRVTEISSVTLLDSTALTTSFVQQIEALNSRLVAIEDWRIVTVSERDSLISLYDAQFGKTAIDIVIAKKAIQGTWTLEEKKGAVIKNFAITITGTAFINGTAVGTIVIDTKNKFTVTGFFASPLVFTKAGAKFTGNIASTQYTLQK